MLWNVWHGDVLLGVVNEKTSQDAADAARETYGTMPSKDGPITRRLKVSACETARASWLSTHQEH